MPASDLLLPPDEPPMDGPPLEAYDDDMASMDVPQEAGAPVDEDFAPPEALAAHRQQQEDAAARAAQQAAEEAEARRRERTLLFERLNERQREAVFLPNESALVLAAAGSGKTSVLTARIARLVTAGTPPMQPRAVLAVTFTNKAALEMRQRLRKLLDRRQVNDLWIGTFHSLCNRMLRENAQAAGLPKSFAILDVDGQEAMCRGILKDLGLTRTAVKAAARARADAAQAALFGEDPAEPQGASANQRLAAAGGLAAGDVESEDSAEFVSPAQCASYISSRKEAGEAPRPPREAPTTRSSEIEQMEAVYAEYQVRCARSGLLDFQDLLTRAVQLLRDNKDVRNALRDRFQAILVDEFQDTNDIQYEWLKLLKGPKAHVMAVGDDDQSIYAFRGAKPENMSHFLRDIAGRGGEPGRLIRLEHNYRSLPHILEAANAVIERNTNRLGKTLRTDKPDAGEKIDLVQYGNGAFEASAVARSIHRLVREQGVSPSEVAILYRTNQQSRLLEAELNKLGLPLTVYGGFRFYERQEVKYVLAYLDLICDPAHDISFAKVANFPPRRLGERTLEELRQDAQVRNTTMMEMVVKRAQWREENPSSIGNGAAIQKQVVLEQFANLIFSLAEKATELPLHQLVAETIEASGLAAHYKAEGDDSGSEETNERLANMAELVSAARQFVLDNQDVEQLDTLSQLTEYLAYVALMTSTSESDMNAKNTISLMTVHSAKGLEFDHVYVTGLEEKTFPHARAMEEDAAWAPEPGAAEAAGVQPGAHLDGPAIQEERRLMYVALTRARKRLELSFCDERLFNGEVRDMEPSRFVDELPPHRIRHVHDAARHRAAQQASGAKGDSPFARAAAAQSSAAGRGRGARRVALIGTAGRDKAMSTHMNRDMWDRMLADAASRIDPRDHLVSGGAAWADHLAVALFLEGKAAGLTLHLPAPLSADGSFEGPGINEGNSSGSVANYYHGQFRRATGVDGLADIAEAIRRGATVTFEPAAQGFGGMNARNKKVAGGCDAMVAYTWGDGDAPADGGTQITWDMARRAQRTHVPLKQLRDAEQASPQERMRA